MSFLLDQRLITWILLGLYALNALQYLLRGQYYGFGYWSGALLITCCAMSGFNR